MMIDSKSGIKKYFFPVYYYWAIISPSLILIVNNIPANRIISFYALFGLIWPLTTVVYPAFLLSFIENNTKLTVLSINIAIPIFFIAWIGPYIHLIWAISKHKKYIIENNDEKVTWGSYISGFL